MASYSTNQFKNGLKVMIDGEPNNIVETEFVKPGKGQAFVRIKVKNLFSGRVVERTLKSGESLEAADVMETSMQYLYKDGDVFHFMDPSSYEQYEASAETLDTAALYLKEEDTCAVTLFNNQLIAVTPPNHVVLKVVETDPGLKGDTSSGGNKPATVETGAVVRVPLFVKIGDQLKVDTRTGEYVSRA